MAANVLAKQVQNKWNNSFARLNRAEPGITGLLAFSEAWRIATDFLYPRDLNDPTPRKEYSMQEVRASFEFLSRAKMLPLLMENFLEDMRKQQHLIERDINEYMAEWEAADTPDFMARLIYRLEKWYKEWSPIPELGSILLSAYTLAFQTHLYSSFPPSFSRGFKQLIASSFSFVNAPCPPWALPPEPHPSLPPGPARQDVFLWSACESLGLLDRYESLIASVCYEYIEAHVMETCAKRWHESMLTCLRGWMTDRVVPWMVMPYARGARSADEARQMLQGVGSRFDYHMCKTLCDLRLQELFDIIIEYPDSMPALQDLKECLSRVDQRNELVKSLRRANRKRLLHPGADTNSIIDQYKNTMNALRFLDPPGVLLYKVADPIRRYLRERPDTIRSIVTYLVGDGEGGEGLGNENENEPIQPLQQRQADDYNDPNWEPEPIDAGPDFRTNKPTDVISTLVSIYDSKDLFVKELQVLLAQRLLAVTDGNYEKERRNIEILKVRFGEAALQVCEVMLRDMTDSRRIDQHIQAQKQMPLHPTIVSRHFWPPLQTSMFNMPGQFKEIQEAYAKEFHLFKPDKKLHWLPHLGTISLDIELQDRTVSAEVPPLEAAIIEHFSTKDTWDVADLATEMKIERAAALKAVLTWVDLGVLKEEDTGLYKLLEVAEEASSSSNPVARQAAMEDTSSVLTVQQQEQEQMKVYWKFIEGMLTNLGSLSLARIQSMLKLAPGYDRTIEQLADFMEAARREGHVTVRDGVWRLQQ
ncbi:ubiquitin-protein ligase [Polyporus arcularius HHB13444]|uniref:Anaphase-promoting complex subunit 2 n=1 Tax=Polyporus arcularius HHB13444 TaxID=1314778 RepID=A0A5C3PN43_9APHY|nr:ubiquitin-protein ligase [Polyporus arcularius HHB13444]